MNFLEFATISLQIRIILQQRETVGKTWCQNVLV